MKTIKIKQIRKLITENPVFVFKDESIENVVSKFISIPVIRAVYVVDNNQKLTGIITIQEILKKVSIDFYSTSFLHASSGFTGYDVLSSAQINKAEDIMNKEIYFVYDEDTIDKAFELLFKNKAGEIPVIAKNGTLIGDLNVIELLVLWKEKIKQ